MAKSVERNQNQSRKRNRCPSSAATYRDSENMGEEMRVEWTQNKRLHTEKDKWGDHIDTKCNLVTVAGLPVSPPHSHGSTWPRWAKESR
jgi:hypothetical protein